MKKIKFILVNDGAAGPRGSAAEPRFNGPKAQFKVQCGEAAVQSSKIKVQGGGDAVQGSLTKVRATRGSMTRFSDLKVQSEGLIEELCRLRKLYPKAKILGVSELGEHCVHPSERMNQLRRELSDL